MSPVQKPIILCIETSTDICSVALSQGPELISDEIDRAGGRRHAALLPTMIDPVLQRAGLQLSDIDAVAYSKGPGSYTGLRVGLSIAKGVCLAMEKPLLGVSSLLALSYAVDTPEPDSLIISMIDAGRDEVYVAGYDTAHHELIPAQPMILTRDTWHAWQESATQLYMVGDGAVKAKIMFGEREELHFGPFEILAYQLIRPAYGLFVNKYFENLAYSVPDYIKAPNYKKSM